MGDAIEQVHAFAAVGCAGDLRGFFGECRNLSGNRWEGWHGHMLNGLRLLIGARVAMGAELQGFKLLLGRIVGGRGEGSAPQECDPSLNPSA